MISFVVPAYNEELLLGRTLDAIGTAAEASGEPFEIIVVDDASTDRTAAIAAEHGARVVPIHHRQISRTRNAGARAAAGNVLFFVDADTLITSAVVAAALRALAGGAVGGGCAVRFDGWLPLYGHVLVRCLLPLYRLLGIAAGCGLFCTREAFEKTGGFDERLLAAEELAFSRALARVGPRGDPPRVGADLGPQASHLVGPGGPSRLCPRRPPRPPRRRIPPGPGDLVRRAAAGPGVGGIGNVEQAESGCAGRGARASYNVLRGKS